MSIVEAHRQPLGEVSQNKPGMGAKDKASVSEEDQILFNKLVVKGKELASQGKVKLALECNKKALAIYQSEKLLKRTAKMETYLKEMESESEDDEEDGDDMVHMGNGFHLYRELYDKLYQHQREGLLWMWKMYQKGKGGILGDDMGLGKTIQVIAFLSGMFDSQTISSVLIILPVAVIVNWEREFDKWAPGIRVEDFHGMTKRERERSLAKVQRRGGVGLTSYGMVAGPVNAEQLSKKDGREFVWDYIILDEGHKIKNPSNKCSKGIHSIPARRRMIMTGTPIQNNLKEMWALFDWTHQGTLLGTARTFGMEFDTPIHRSRQKDATAGERRLGEEMALGLQKIIKPYFLRRTKAEVAQSKPQKGAAGGKGPAMPTLTRKNDLICWVFLSDIQLQIYEDFVQTEEVQELLNSTRSPLVKLMVLKKICDHPRLLSNRQCIQLGLQLDNGLSQKELEDIDEDTQKECAANRIRHIDNDILIKESGKMVFLMELLDNLKADGHRCLVFSQSRKILDIIQKVLSARGHKVARLDGTMRHLQEREEIIAKFSRDKSYSVFLLTTQVGGVGLTLTAADRVVIYDPSWNPATDAQAVDRAFRIGQDKNVVIYRLITCGSVEEKIYRRQIFKDSITRQTTGDSKNPYRYFTRDEIYALFELDNPKVSTTQQQLQEMHTNQRKTDTSLDAHIAYLHTLEMFGISDHDLMFSQQEKATEETEEDAGNDYIQSRVAKAQQLLSLENEENENMTNQHGKYRAPEVFKEDAPKRQPATRPQPKNPSSNFNREQFEQEEEVLEKTMEDLELASGSLTPPRSAIGHEVIDLDTPVSEKPQQYQREQDATVANYDSDDAGSVSDAGSPYDDARETVNDDEDAEMDNEAIAIEESSIESPQHGIDLEKENMAISIQRTPSDAFNKRKREASSASSTPRALEEISSMSKKQRRRSVAAGLTPRKGSADISGTPVDSPKVVTEQLVFSPQLGGPVIQTKSLSDVTVDYEGFKSPFNIRANSTAIVEVPEDEEEEYGEENLDESIIGGAKKKTHRKAVILSDSENEDGDEGADADQSLGSVRSSPVHRVDDSLENSLEEMEDSHHVVSDSVNYVPNSASNSQQGSPSTPRPSSRKVTIACGRQPKPEIPKEEDRNDDEDNESASMDTEDVETAEDKAEESSLEKEAVEEEAAAAEEIKETEEETEQDEEGEDEEDDEGEEDEDEEESEEEEAAAAEEMEETEEETEQEEEGEDEEEDEGEEDEDEEESEEEEELTQEEQQQYISLMMKSRELYKEGHLTEALRFALDGLDIYGGDDKAKAYALKIQQKLMRAQQK